MAILQQETRYEGLHCTLSIRQVAVGVVLLEICGTDIGEFGDAPMQKMNGLLAGALPVRLFIDARNVRGASIEVSGEWAKWLSAHKLQLADISMLTGSRFVEVTAAFVRRFADLESMMQIYTDPAAFHAALAEAERS